MKTTISKTKILPLNDIQVNDSFWSYYIDLVKNVVVPYQWDALNDRIADAEPSHAIKNFKIAAGEEQGEFQGMVFQDSDLAKWLEAVGYLLSTNRDPELEKIADGVIDTIAKAQREDGYLNTYFTLKEPGKRWTNLAECHELYCAGHMIEGAVAYFKATGKRKILDVVIKFADHIDEVFGTDPGKIRGYDGHQEIELALMKLYEVTSNEKYLRMSQFFLEERGKEPHFYDREIEKRGGATHFGSWIARDKSYSQAHKPIHEQDKAVGHAVRFVYMCTGIAHFAAATGNREMVEACKRLWTNMVSKQMYITGGIGSQSHGEAFSFDYDLPNDTVYAETCASIGLVFFAQRMLQLEANSQYADVMERALYNTVLGGMSYDGKSFFYVNPLEVYPQACDSNQNYRHVKPVRQRWFGCACCPPNVARMIASLGQYIYTIRDNIVYTHLYVSGQARIDLDGGNLVTLEQESNYPWDGNIKFTVNADQETKFTLALRIPEWCDQAEIFINGERESVDGLVVNGYAMLNRTWKPGDQIELVLSMPVERVKGHPLVRQTAGKVALQRGPIVYCLEGADNGSNLYNIMLPSDGQLDVEDDADLLGGMKVITGEAVKRKTGNWGETLYKRNANLEAEDVSVKFIPYFAWANRGLGEMLVWVNERENN